MRWYEIIGDGIIDETSSGCISGGNTSLFSNKKFPEDRYWPYPKKSKKDKKTEK